MISEKRGGVHMPPLFCLYLLRSENQFRKRGGRGVSFYNHFVLALNMFSLNIFRQRQRLSGIKKPGFLWPLAGVRLRSLRRNSLQQHITKKGLTLLVLWRLTEGTPANCRAFHFHFHFHFKFHFKFYFSIPYSLFLIHYSLF